MKTPLDLNITVSFLPIMNSWISFSYVKNVLISEKSFILIFKIELLGILSNSSFSLV